MVILKKDKNVACVCHLLSPMAHINYNGGTHKIAVNREIYEAKLDWTMSPVKFHW